MVIEVLAVRERRVGRGLGHAKRGVADVTKHVVCTFMYLASSETSFASLERDEVIVKVEGRFAGTIGLHGVGTGVLAGRIGRPRAETARRTGGNSVSARRCWARPCRARIVLRPCNAAAGSLSRGPPAAASRSLLAAAWTSRSLPNFIALGSSSGNQPP